MNSKRLKGRQMNKQKLPHYAQGCVQEPLKNDDPEMLWFCGDQYKLVLQFDETKEPDWQKKITEAQAFYHRQEMPAIIKNDEHGARPLRKQNIFGLHGILSERVKV